MRQKLGRLGPDMEREQPHEEEKHMLCSTKEVVWCCSGGATARTAGAPRTFRGPCGANPRSKEHERGADTETEWDDCFGDNDEARLLDGHKPRRSQTTVCLQDNMATFIWTSFRRELSGSQPSSTGSSSPANLQPSRPTSATAFAKSVPDEMCSFSQT